MNTKDFWSEDNKVNIWGDYSAPVRKTCHSCFHEFETVDRWAQRCPPCKKRNAPKRKLITNNKLLDKPF